MSRYFFITGKRCYHFGSVYLILVCINLPFCQHLNYTMKLTHFLFNMHIIFCMYIPFIIFINTSLFVLVPDVSLLACFFRTFVAFITRYIGVLPCSWVVMNPFQTQLWVAWVTIFTSECIKSTTGNNTEKCFKKICDQNILSYLFNINNAI